METAKNGEVTTVMMTSNRGTDATISFREKLK